MTQSVGKRVQSAEKRVIEFPIEDAFIQDCKLRKASKVTTRTVEVTIPRVLLLNVSRKYGMTVEEFVKKFKAVAYFTMSDEVLYRFKRIEEN